MGTHTSPKTRGDCKVDTRSGEFGQDDVRRKLKKQVSGIHDHQGGVVLMAVDANIVFEAAQSSIREVVPVKNAVKTTKLVNNLNYSSLCTELTSIRIE